MGSHVSGKGGLNRNCFPTKVTTKWFLSSVDSLMVCKTVLICEKAFPQMSHTNGFSPVWTLWWSVRLFLCEKSFPQMSQTNDLFQVMPVWTLWQLVRLFFWEKAFPQMSQAKWFLSSVDSQVADEAGFTWKSVPQMSLTNGFSPVWFLWWLLKLLFLDK